MTEQDQHAMGAAIREAEGRRSLAEAVENGWPTTTASTKGESRPPRHHRARTLALELQRHGDSEVREAATLLAQLTNELAAQPDPTAERPAPGVDRERLAFVLMRIDGYQLARAAAIRNGTLDIYLAKADALIPKLQTLLQGTETVGER